MFECYSRKTATFLILGNTCTRNCAFCNIGGGIIHARPRRARPRGQGGGGLGPAPCRGDVRGADELPDGGSASRQPRAIRDSGETCPTIEVLIPDFRGSRSPANRHERRAPHHQPQWKPLPRITAASGSGRLSAEPPPAASKPGASAERPDGRAWGSG
ncbi:MAG: hypothetical protein ACLSHC_15825 [Bilophila wadsworthia]